MPQTIDVATRKRQQIAQANKVMFFWVAGISAIVGVAAVMSVFLVQKLIFNEKVLAKKQNTASTLVQNNSVVQQLKQNVLVRNTDQALLDSRSKQEDTALQVILDALPSKANSSALGSSLQQVLLPAPDISIETLKVDPSAEEAAVLEGSEGSAAAAPAAEMAGEENTISFSFVVSTPTTHVDNLRQLLERLERSIRPINVHTVSIEAKGDTVSLTVEAVAYYEPPKVVELREETVKP
jgi:hypothetical protein